MLAINFLFALFIVIRLFNLQVMNYGFYAALASGQHDIYEKLFPTRGKIYIQEIVNKEKKLYPVATNQELYLVYAEPVQIADSKGTADKLGEIFKFSPEDIGSLAQKLAKENDYYEPLFHKVTDEQLSLIDRENLKGIGHTSEILRYYPEGNMGSHLIGFVGYQGNAKKGCYGIEGYFDSELAGREGYLSSEKDAYGRIITMADQELKNAVDGSDIVLTIDRAIQFTACNDLKKAVEKHGASGGSVVVMDPITGAILAMCSVPDYDPNHYSEITDINLFNNPIIFNRYEPGSVFKALTMAGAIDAGKVKPETTYVDTGSVTMDGHTIKNAHDKSYGRQNMVDVLKNSINTGAIFAVEQLGVGKFQEYVKKFGFDAATGITLDTEVAGDISSLNKKRDIYAATASFGQGITVTSMQMLTAYAALANQGKLVKPYIVDEVIKSDGTEIKTQPEEIRQVVTPRTAALLSGMLVSVIRDGHAKSAGVEGYYIAGKTGTAQVPDPKTGNYGDLTIHSFIGYGPIDNPRFVMLTKLDDPKSAPFAESTAAPLFGEIAKFILNYLEVPPDVK